MTAVLSQTPATAKAAPLILLMIIFIDGLGTALLLPMRLYGVLLAGYAFAMMVGAPLLGALSDRIGRRPTRVGHRVCPEHLGL